MKKMLSGIIALAMLISCMAIMPVSAADVATLCYVQDFGAMTTETLGTADEWGMKTDATIVDASEITAATNVDGKMKGKVLKLAAGDKKVRIDFEALGVVSGGKYVVEFDMLQETMSTTRNSNYIFFSGGAYPGGYTSAFGNSANNWQLIRNATGAGNMHKSKHYKIVMDLTSVSAAKVDYWVIDNSNNWALTYSDTVNMTDFFTDFGLTFVSYDYALYIDNFVVSTPGAIEAPSIPYVQNFDATTTDALGLTNEWGMKNDVTIVDASEITAATNVNGKMKGKVLKLAAGDKRARIDFENLGMVSGGKYVVEFDMLQETMSTTKYSNYIYFSGGDYPGGYTVAFANSANNWQLIRNKQGAGNMHKSKHYKIVMDLTLVSAAKFDYWVIDNSNNWALTYSDTVDVTAFFKDFGLTFVSCETALYVDNLVVRTPGEAYVPALPYEQDFSNFAEFGDEITAGLWSLRGTAGIENGKLKISPDGIVADMDLTKLGLKADGTEYEISFDISVDSWANSSNFNRLQIQLWNQASGYLNIFDECSYNDASKAETILLGKWTGGNGVKSHSVKYNYNPQTGAISGAIGNWASNSETWSAGNTPAQFRFHANGADTFYVDNIVIKEAEAYVPVVPVFEISAPKMFDGAKEVATFSELKAATEKTVKVDWKNTKEDESVVVIVAYYGAGDVFVGGEASTDQPLAVEVAEGTITYPLTKAIPANATYAKVMVWDNLTDFQPMTTALTLNN